MNAPDWLKDYTHKFAADGSLVMIVPLIMGTARITISRPAPWMFDCVDDGW